jgi:hypothetical protein
MVKRPGEERLVDAVRKARKGLGTGKSNNPKPYDHSWGWWIEQRLERLEGQTAWLLRLALATLAGEVIRIVLGTMGLGS